MRTSTFQYTLHSDSWSVSSLPDLDSPQTMLLAFGATEIQTAPRVLELIRSHYPNSHILGCSTAGEVLNGRLTDGTLSVAVINFENTRLSSSSIVVRDPSHSLEAGNTLGAQLVASGQPSAVLVLAEGLRLDHGAFLTGLQQQLGPTPIVGALAADSQRYEASWVWLGERLQSGLVGAVAFYGPGVSVHSTVSDIWGEDDQIERTITRASNNVVFTIGGVPAADVCSSESGLMPIRIVNAAGTGVLASPLGANAAEKSVVFNRVVPEGSKVHVVKANPDCLIEEAGKVAQVMHTVANNLSTNGTVFALANSAAGRRLFLGEGAQSEITSLSEQFPEDLPLIGLYSYGSVAPGKDSRVEITNAGFGVTLISEEMSTSQSQAVRPGGKARTTGSLATDATAPGAPHARKPKFINSKTATSLVQTRPSTFEMGDSRADWYDLGTLQFISIQGTINESFLGRELAEKMSGRVVMDLGTVELITSFGVRGWLDMMAEAERRGVNTIYLAHCSEAVVNQMLMVRNFRGRGQVVSFGAPYICTACSTTFEYLLDCEHSAEEIASASPPDVACPSCGNRAVFDEDPDLYLDFVAEDLGKALPFDVRNTLAERRLEWMTQVDDAIEKRIEGDQTVYRINRTVDEKIRWKRVLSGVEGKVRLDFARAPGANDLGAERFLSAIRVETDRVSELMLDQVPLEIVHHIIDSEPIPKLRVRTLSLPARCSNCGVVRQASVDPVGIREAHRHGLQPESQCRRCSGSVPIALPPDIVAYFSGGAAPSLRVRTGGGTISPLVYIAAGGVILLIVIIVLAMAT